MSRTLRAGRIHFLRSFTLLLLLTLAVTPPLNGETVTYVYDAAGRLQQVTYDDGSQVTYTLDAAGNRTQVASVPPTPITAPPGLTVSPASGTTMSLAWSAPTGGSGTYPQFNVYRGGSLLTTVGTRSYTDSGLTVHTSYSYTVSAIDSDNNTSPQSAAVANYTYALPIITSFTATTVSDSAITLNWAASDTNGPGLGGFTLKRNGTQIATPGGSATSYPDTGLSPGTSYSYTLIANDGHGDNSSTSTATGGTYPLPSISSFAATAASTTSMTLAWTASDTGGPGGLTYSVVRGSTTVAGCTASPCTDSGLSIGTNYSYTLTAKDSANDTATASASGTTLPGAPGTPSFSSVTGTSATANWTAAAGTVSSYAYSINGGSTWTNVGSALSASLTGLSVSTHYTVLVHAINGGGTGASSTASFTTASATDTLPWANGSTIPLCGGQFANTSATVSFQISAGSENVTVSPSNSIYTVTTTGWTSGTVIGVGTYSIKIAGTFSPDGDSPITITFAGTGDTSTATVHVYEKPTCP